MSRLHFAHITTYLSPPREAPPPSSAKVPPPSRSRSGTAPGVLMADSAVVRRCRRGAGRAWPGRPLSTSRAGWRHALAGIGAAGVGEQEEVLHPGPLHPAGRAAGDRLGRCGARGSLLILSFTQGSSTRRSTASRQWEAAGELAGPGFTVDLIAWLKAKG